MEFPGRVVGMVADHKGLLVVFVVARSGSIFNNIRFASTNFHWWRGCSVLCGVCAHCNHDCILIRVMCMTQARKPKQSFCYLWGNIWEEASGNQGDTRKTKGTRAKPRGHTQNQGDTRKVNGTHAKRRGHAQNQGDTRKTKGTSAKPKWRA